PPGPRASASVSMWAPGARINVSHSMKKSSGPRASLDAPSERAEVFCAGVGNGHKTPVKRCTLQWGLTVTEPSQDSFPPPPPVIRRTAPVLLGDPRLRRYLASNPVSVLAGPAELPISTSMFPPLTAAILTSSAVTLPPSIILISAG